MQGFNFTYSFVAEHIPNLQSGFIQTKDKLNNIS
jgi:hypothetical protein